MTETTHLSLPFIDAAQAQKHVTHNEALQRLDALVQLSAIARDQSAPPASPAEGERYLVGPGATGAFAGRDMQIATWLAGGWTFFAPRPGWRLYVAAEQILLLYDGSTWNDAGLALRTLQNLERLGLGATADAGNPLSAKLNAALFAAKSVGEGGSGDLRFTLNKSASGNTVSQLYQTDWSGRAETGLTGDDHFHVKVSADGSSWKEAIDIDPATGQLATPLGRVHSPTGKKFSDFLFTPGGDGEVSIYRNDTPRAQIPRASTIASIASDTITLTGASDANLFFSNAYMSGVAYVRIWNVTKSPNLPAWVKFASAANQLRVTSASDISSWSPGEVVQIGDPTSTLNSFAIDISQMMQNVLGAVFPQTGVIAKSGVSGVAAAVGLSGTGSIGSFVNTQSPNDGSKIFGMAIVACNAPSPISNSNLVYVREAVTAPNLVTSALFSMTGVFA